MINIKDLRLESLDIQGEQEIDYSTYEERVKDILHNVKKEGNQAILKYTQMFDGVLLDEKTMVVSEDEINQAYEGIDEAVKEAIRQGIDRIRTYHLKQKSYSWFDKEGKSSLLGQMITPMDRVGIYVPGGTAIYPSSVYMNAIPAQVAGVGDIVMVTPPNEMGEVDPLLLFTAKEVGIKEIYKIGGAQAIGALAYGTDTLDRVNKIVGPGNIYVTLAKRQVFGYVGIDAIAGPSEVLVLADERANPIYVAADLLSQAEHDELARCFLITPSETLAKAVVKELEVQSSRLSRENIIRKSLEKFGWIYLVNSIEEGIEVSNTIAPEHMEICVENAMSYLPLIKHAGAIFLGDYSPEPLGDYMAGPNHVLPTSGTAKFFSPLGVNDFIKRSSIIAFSKEDLQPLSTSIQKIAKAEGLTAHANAIAVRGD